MRWHYAGEMAAGYRGVFGEGPPADYDGRRFARHFSNLHSFERYSRDWRLLRFRLPGLAAV